MARPLTTRLVLWAFERFYHEGAFTYDAVAWLVSRGYWSAWIRAVLPDVAACPILELGCGTGYLQQSRLASPHLTVGLVTIHEPLRSVPDLLTTAEIVKHGKLLAEFCQRRGKANPRIAVAGLNPHAGENGRMGMEEITIIKPAVEVLNLAGSGALFHGPLPPDTLFFHAARGQYDAVLCMYHDQGLIPLKLLDFDEAVNLETLRTIIGAL